MKKANKGFTLTELLVVVLVIGILAAIATPLYFKTIKKSKASDALNVLTAAAERQEGYFVANGKYATGFTDLGAPVKGLEGDKNKSASGVKIGNFKYQMSDSCISAASTGTNSASDEDDYVIYRNFITQQEGCVGKGCEVLKGVIDTISAVSCPPVVVSNETEDPNGNTDPCVANPSLCCPSGTTWNGTKCVGMECPTGKVYDSVKKACVCAIQCPSGIGVLDEATCKCSCTNSCIGGQVRDDACNCACPSTAPNWDSVNSKCIPACAAPKTRWTGNECACPIDSPLFTGNSCVSCPVNKPWNGTACACPSDLPYDWGDRCAACSQSSVSSLKAACESTQYGPAGTWTGIMCSCDCREENSVFSGGHCACPTNKPIWNGSSCQQCPDDRPWNGTKCACPEATPYEYNGTCNKCSQSETLSNGICCPSGKISLDGKTCVYAYKAERVAVGILIDCHNTYSYIDKKTCRRTGSLSYFIGGKLPYVAAGGGCTVHHAYYNGGLWWEGGEHQGYSLPSCNTSISDQKICDQNCTGSTCTYKCIVNQTTPSTCGVYNCSNGRHCDNNQGSGTMLRCVRA